MSGHDAFERILTSLHEAVLDDVHWPTTTALIDEACGLTSNALLVGEGPNDDLRVLFVGLYYRGRLQARLLSDGIRPGATAAAPGPGARDRGLQYRAPRDRPRSPEGKCHEQRVPPRGARRTRPLAGRGLGGCLSALVRGCGQAYALQTVEPVTYRCGTRRVCQARSSGSERDTRARPHAVAPMNCVPEDSRRRSTWTERTHSPRARADGNQTPASTVAVRAPSPS